MNREKGLHIRVIVVCNENNFRIVQKGTKSEEDHTARTAKAFGSTARAFAKNTATYNHSSPTADRAWSTAHLAAIFVDHSTLTRSAPAHPFVEYAKR